MPACCLCDPIRMCEGLRNSVEKALRRNFRVHPGAAGSDCASLVRGPVPQRQLQRRASANETKSMLQAFVWVADAPDTDQAPSALRPGGRGLTHGTRIAPPSADRCAIRRKRRKRARRRRRIAAAGVRRMRGRRRAVRRPHDAANSLEPERSRPKDGLPFLWRRPADGARAAERGSVAHTKA